MQIQPLQEVRASGRGWPLTCSVRGMRSNRGFSLIELLLVIGFIGTFGAMALPVMFDANNRNSVWTTSEQIGSQVRQARLKAITRNMTFQVRFDCPSARQYRVLVVDGTINDAGRCDSYLTHDSGVFTLPANVSYTNTATLQVNGRGQYSIVGGGGLPRTITVQHGNGHARTLTVSVTGQITFATF